MSDEHGGSRGVRAMLKEWIQRASVLRGTATLLLAGTLPAVASSQRRTGTAQQPHTVLSLDTTGFDTTVPPCQDFYQYVNGAWLKRTPAVIPDSTVVAHTWGLAPAQGTESDLAAQARGTLLHLLEQAQRAAPRTTDPITRVLGTFYASCLAAAQAADPSEPAAVKTYHCFTATDSALGRALGHAYVQAAFPPALRIQALAFATQIRTTLQERISAAVWMSPSTKQQALSKLATIQLVLGGKVSGGESLDDYQKLVLSPTAYTDNLRAIRSFEWRRFVGGIHSAPVDSSLSRPYIIRGDYDNADLSVTLSAYWWQPPVFVLGGDPAWNFGAMGYVIGHELTHGFGPVSLNDGWLALNDTLVYTKMTQQLVAEYNQFGMVDSVSVDGDKTLDENFADVGGVSLAYAAFEQATRGVPRRRLQGFTPEQRFFLSFARFNRRKVAVDGGRADSHAPDRVRVNGSLANLPAFAQAFGCKASDAMVQPMARRVTIW